MYGGFTLTNLQKGGIFIPSTIAIAYCIKNKKSILSSVGIVFASALGGLIITSFIRANQH